MITDDEVLRLFERADPARVDDDAAAVDAAGYLDALRTRSSNVTIIEPAPTPTEPTGGRRRAIILAAAAAAVVIVVGAVVLATRNNDTTEPITDQTPVPTDVVQEPGNDTPVEVARGFVEAYGALDADQAITYLADDADLTELTRAYGNDEAAGTLDQLRLVISFLEAAGHKQMLDSCDQESRSAAGTTVRCTYDFHSFGSAELDRGPFRGSYFELVVRDSEIVHASTYLETDQFSPQMWVPFAAWMEANYPEDAAAIFTPGGNGALATPESIPLWEQHVREYVATHGVRDEKRVGFVGLPPEGATPSTPERGELIMYVAGPEVGSRTWVYADGRLIWHRYANLPEGANEVFTGFLEQRLTPEGVELLRAEAVSLIAELLDDQRAGVPPGSTTSASPQACSWNLCEIRVRNNGRLDRLAWPPGEASALVARITDPASWLPASAWEDQEIKAYVPSRYSVLMEPRDSTLLPEAAQDLLEDPVLTLAEVRALDQALDDAGIEQNSTAMEDGVRGPSRYSLTYRIDRGGDETPTIERRYIIVEPYLPHGGVYCQHCG